MDKVWFTLQVLKMATFGGLSTVICFCRDPKMMLWVLQLFVLAVMAFDAAQVRYLARFNMIRRGF
ncbi:MAG: hypothetical protein EOO38_04240 [Cytophagaceae bacterium]|jgi:hypothetical protein|nr:MAG: hypothetical protein EOO38_04240 [Cytophagaceae bacterium]